MAQTQSVRRKAQVAVVEETVQDTLETAVLGDVFLAEVSDPPITVESSNIERTEMRNDYMKGLEVPGSVSASLGFKLFLKGSAGAVDVPPEIGEFLKACGFVETVDVGVDVVYTPASTFDGAGGNPGPSYSATVLEDLVNYSVAGAFGNFTISGEHGTPLALECTMQGKYVAPVNSTMLVPVYQNAVPPAFLGATVTLAGAAPVGIQGFSLDLGNQISMGRDVTEATGFYGSRIVDRRIMGSLTLEMMAPGTTDFFALWRAGAAAAVVVTVGSGTGGTVSIGLPKCIRRPVELASNDEIRTATIPFAVNSDNADAEGTNMTLTFS